MEQWSTLAPPPPPCQQSCMEIKLEMSSVNPKSIVKKTNKNADRELKLVLYFKKIITICIQEIELKKC